MQLFPVFSILPKFGSKKSAGMCQMNEGFCPKRTTRTSKKTKQKNKKQKKSKIKLGPLGSSKDTYNLVTSFELQYLLKELIKRKKSKKKSTHRKDI